MNKPRGRPFAPGNQYGRGRPKGSRNQRKMPGQHLLEEYGEHLMRKCIAMAMQGERSAMGLCMARISPARRDAFVEMALPTIETAQDVERAAEKVTRAIRRGEVTPSEGQTLMHILESRSRIVERVTWEDRLAKLEARVSTGGKLQES